ncbi:MAG: hypothetical protein ISS35_06435 [Kiritimatiellae bacterium]|nr:hypothetical protein [Kiritimatiellia bacterium]
MGAAEELEKKSSAVTLSDMEMFLFPELMYSLMLANIMSPRIWKWLEDPWFDDLDKMKPYRRIQRLKQYIMDHYAFNLDLDTWGLTTTEREIGRFKHIISEETLAKSNALFGYEGDKYYFDIDIRTHFGLDKYTSNVIPYWKTETVEAMDAFCHREEYERGAGECVSLAALYGAALFIIAKIPLQDIYLMATPLHSQNFVNLNGGILTNNRRLVTKNMWFNGTALSEQARRALENEQVTIVTHESGVIHTIYQDATIDPSAYQIFSEQLSAFLKIDLTPELLGNFVRHDSSIHKCFQVRGERNGKSYYIAVEKALNYEYGSSYRLTDNTRDKLLADIDTEAFEPNPLKSRIILNDLETFIQTEKIDINKEEDVARLKEQFASDCLSAEIAIQNLCSFCHTKPRLPDGLVKKYRTYEQPLGIEQGMKREEIIDQLKAVRSHNELAAMSFYAFRDLNVIDVEPFLKACIERNPVCIEATENSSNDQIIKKIEDLPNMSIYDGPGRLAQPDEVWNYGRGDGVEKAVMLATVLRPRRPTDEMTICLDDETVEVNCGILNVSFRTSKALGQKVWTIPPEAQV